ncbi:3754_t:CDS:2, partial [Acaulospora morrowiae]
TSFNIGVLGEDFSEAELTDLSDSKDIVLRTRHDAALVKLTSMKWFLLRSSDEGSEIINSAFFTDGDCVIVETNYSVTTGYLFTASDGKCKKEFIISENHDGDNIKLSTEGKIFLCNRAIHVIMQWDIKTLKLEKQWILRWNFSPHNLDFVINESHTLLAIWKYEFIYVYSMETYSIVAS